MIDIATRNSRLMSLSQMLVDNKITYKLDHIANVQINGQHYFSVFRRYNSVYEIVIEDMRGDIYCHKDYRIRQSIEDILCISHQEANNLYTVNAVSYKYNSPITTAIELGDLRWSELQKRYYAVNVNFGGILQDFQYSYNAYNQTQTKQYPLAQPMQTETQTQTNYVLNPEDVKEEDVAAANTLLRISIPTPTDQVCESDRPTLSMKFTDIMTRKRKREESCYCKMDCDNVDDSSEGSQSGPYELNDMYYTVLRNGTRIPKTV